MVRTVGEPAEPIDRFFDDWEKHEGFGGGEGHLFFIGKAEL